MVNDLILLIFFYNFTVVQGPIIVVALAFLILLLDSTLALEPVIDDLKGDLKETFETYNELFYSCQDKIQKQNELYQVCFHFHSWLLLSTNIKNIIKRNIFYSLTVYNFELQRTLKSKLSQFNIMSKYQNQKRYLLYLDTFYNNWVFCDSFVCKDSTVSTNKF